MAPEDYPEDKGPWQAIADAMRSAALCVDATGKVTHRNDAAQALFGASLQGAELTPLLLRPAPMDTATGSVLRIEDLPHERVLRTGQPQHCQVTWRDGSGRTRWMDVTARPITEGGRLQGAAIVLRDVTERMEAERTVLLRERALADASEGITIADATLPDMPLIYVNEGFTRITGYPREEVLGRNCRFLQGESPNEEAREVIRDALEHCRRCTVELRNYRKDGTPFWNRLAIAPVLDDTGRPTHFVGVQSDITRQVETERALREANQRLQRDLATAARVQRALLPPPDIQMPGMEVAWRVQACEELAGDSLNIMRLDERHWALYVLDVVGHGTAASLLSVAVTHALNPATPTDSLTLEGAGLFQRSEPTSPAQVMEKLNRQFPWDSESGQFFTLIYAVLDTRSHRVTIATAGHPGALHLNHDGEARFLAGEGLPIGVDTGDYTEVTIDLLPGDRLFMYSDGVLETMDNGRELFGKERLIEVLQRSQDGAARDTLEALQDSLDTFRGTASPDDDLSMIMLKRS